MLNQEQELCTESETREHTPTIAAAQASWFLDRLDYISKAIGIRWIDSISSS